MLGDIKQCSCENVGTDRVCWDGEGGDGDEGDGKGLEREGDLGSTL
jgi:hypothetical protein